LPLGNRSIRLSFSALALVVAIAVGTSADPPPAGARERHPEESRLSTAVFRAGLKRRGLTELLELHLRDFPPTSETERLIMMREVKLAEFADPTLPLEQQRAAIAVANRILGQLIEASFGDLRRFEWRFTLAHSLVYDEAEPFLTSILYRGGSKEDRRQLRSLSTRAVAALTVLVKELAEEYDRIDRMSIREFEKLEADGYVEQLDRLAPRSEYLLLWALFYNSLPREDIDPTRARQLNEILERVAGNPTLINTPHTTSHVQVQALLLTGMTHRLLNNHQPAREHLDRALAVAAGINDPAERRRVDWSVTLAWLEAIRNEADDGRFDDALRRLTQFRTTFTSTGGDDFGLKVAAALLERSVLKRRATAADQAGRADDAQQYRQEAWQPLARLARQEPDRRDELYATLYDMIGPEADPDQLDPFERCALIAGLLFDADQLTETSDVLLDRAIAVGGRFVADITPIAESLLPEVLYNVAVAQYRRGRLAAAAQRFLEVARDHAAFGNARQAATFAVQLAAELYGDSSLRSRPEVQRLYRDALEVLETRYRDTAAAHYWRFYYAQLLDELGEYAPAAAQYALVDRAHEHYLESMFFRARCLALDLQERAVEDPPHRFDLLHRIDDFLVVQQEFVALASSELNRQWDAQRVSTVRDLLARARLLAAEVYVLPHAAKPAKALETLTGFEDDYPDEEALAGRVWRVRLLAYEKLGRIEDAKRVIPTYIAADPENAGPVLQSLYQSVVEDFQDLQKERDNTSAQRKAEMALLVARQIHEWAIRSDVVSPLPDHRTSVQLAEANLRAGHYQRARELFEPFLAANDGLAAPQSSTDVRVVLGHAEALLQLGEFASALPGFNRLAMGLPPTDPIRWKALLRDLQCRTALGHAPQGIIKVIQQHKQLYPELGGPALAPQFEKLQRENERRLDQGS